MNSFIPIVIKPYPDELLFSWVKRLAEANGLSFSSFINTYFYKRKSNKALFNAEMRVGFMDFYEALNINIDANELYLSLSTLSFESLAYPQKYQTRIVNNIFRPLSGLNQTKEYFFRKAKVCPDCINEDTKKYKNFYLHRSHQLSGVNVCHKHNKPLYEISINTAEEYNLKKVAFNTVDFEPNEEDFAYAKYANLLLNENIQSNSNDILELLFLKFNKDSKKQSYRKEFLQDIQKILNVDKVAFQWERNGDILPIKDIVKLLMYFYPKPEILKQELKSFSIINKYFCNKCNKYFYATEASLENGWDCHYCDSLLTDQQLFKRLVLKSGKKEYSLNEDFQSLSTKISLQHLDCGKEFSVTPSDFLFKQVRCKCQIFMHKKDADKIMANYPEFELLEFKGSSYPAKIRHISCGKTFELTSFREFKHSPNCRYCGKSMSISPETFREKVKDLVGDEYEVLEDLHRIEDRVKIKHVKCGKIHSYRGELFLLGSRCPDCYVKMSKNKLDIALQEYTNGRYIITGQNRYRFHILDTKTNETFELSGKQISQEIHRPTKSNIFKVNNKQVQLLDTWNTWYQLCVEYKSEFGHLMPKRGEKYKGRGIAEWISEQRADLNHGRLSKDKEEKLKEIGFVSNMIDAMWYQRFEEYKDYAIKTKDYLPKTTLVYEGKKIGSWVKTQRQQEFRHRLPEKYKNAILEFNSDFFDSRKF